jgi:hypothetical protein
LIASHFEDLGEAKVSDGERLACWTGAILLGFATMLMMWDEGGRNRRHRRNYEEPVEVLAEELKEAWASYHTP